MMDIQYILNSEGEKTGVVIPIEEWEQIKKLLQELNNEDINSRDEHFLKGLQKAVQEVNNYKTGNTELKNLDELLNEL
jgi:CheY-specific phosphatase CheX